jgi:hypothetical protein
LSSGPIPEIELRDSDGNIARERLSIDDGPAWGYCVFYKVRKSDRYYLVLYAVGEGSGMYETYLINPDSGT